MNITNLLTILVFFNYYNPLSVSLTLIVNVFFFIGLSIINAKEGLRRVRLNQTVLIISFVLCLWALLLMITNWNFNVYVFGKYFRTLISSILLMMVISLLKPNASQLIKALSFIFLLHVVFVFLQVLFPQLDVPMAQIFGFNRKTEIISSMSIRKLGLSSSYDTAALISIASMIFFFLRYLIRPKIIFILLSLLSLASTVRISRTGMVIGVLIFGIFAIYFIRKFKGRKRIALMSLFGVGMLLAVYLMLPIIAASTVSLLLESQSDGMVVSNDDYSTGSTLSLLNSLYDAMQISWQGFVFGLGIDPNNLVGRHTDIGYIKIVYHVGLIGSILLFYLHFYFYRASVKVKRIYHKDLSLVLLSNFVVLYMVLLGIMNVKSLEIYSRGAYELLLISFLILVGPVSKETSTELLKFKPQRFSSKWE